MPKAITDALASSTAHGIGRVVTSPSRAMKVMWCALFLFFLAIFIRTAVALVARLREDALAKSFEIDKVEFMFPDLYFCPSNPYSGSYPYDLSSAEAELINSAVANLSAEFDARYEGEELGLRTRLLQNSLPVHLSFQLLAQRRDQAVQQQFATPTMGPPPRYMIRPRISAFSHPVNLVCFKMSFSDGDRKKIVSDSWQVDLRLSTDPYFADLNYSGRRVDPIRDPRTGAEVPLQDWDLRVGSAQLQETGFTMLIVPVGSYPSLMHEAKFQLAPGNAYTVALSMEETAFSEELHGTHCQANHGSVDFADYLTGGRLTFAYSPAACYYEMLAQLLAEEYGCLPSSTPLVWRLRNTTRCLNMTETSQEGLHRVRVSRIDWHALNQRVQATCRPRSPCRYQHYSASFSFSRWPSVGSSTVQYFASTRDSRYITPVAKRLREMARALQNDSHAAHTEASFRTYLTESLISVRIVAQRRTSPQVVISPAYSVTAFLADTGGLLGLYIGCSLLTVCELIELFYRLLSSALLKLYRRLTGSPEHPADDADDADAAEKLRVGEAGKMENADVANVSSC